MKETPYWWEAAPQEAQATIELPAQADVAIIGAGYTGLSAALTLARAGRQVLVLESEAPGWGASTRSGGMIGHGHRLSYSGLIAKYGSAKAQSLIREGMASLDFVKTLIDAEGLDADLQRTGRVRGAWTDADYLTMGREAEALKRDFGLDVDVLSQSDVRREVTTQFYKGGLIFHSHGAVHPAKFHRALLHKAHEAGAQVAAFTRVNSLAPDGQAFQIATSRGTLRARDVLIATNGYTFGLSSALARRLIPFPSFIIATQEIGTELVQQLIPNGRMIVETREKHLYYRPSPDGKRIVLGGRAALHPIPLRNAAQRLRRELVTLFPALANVAISHCWTGRIAMTKSDLPAIGRHEGIHYVFGCNGSGVALMPYLGHRAALKILGKPEGATAFDDVPAPSLPFYNGRPWFLPLFTLAYRAKDWWRGD
ncbi:NAD(P)/FAD-dependent oxidoreductase [Methylovirgula sp. 4M-Z18]|uniref:NAD(P)/FAD-dependent oxidoreductase n=1 Tax=Methylovirgula sp. 4M-Z18 TaxID=2293567 RepID=UPI000E2ECDA1|nr:FAD-binding oxidoreductase [Methylovirgula sp. 4M-Z18]RFB79871.1 FAD-binding oxidoreductase [Methylovirgula sp. 4M-Z18]